MLALGIIIVILILILILPVGGDAAYENDIFSLAIKIGPFKKSVVAAGEKDEKKEKKQKPPKKKDKPTDAASKKKKKTGKLKLSFDDVLAVVRIGLKTLGRFWRSISIDLLKLHLHVGGTDPYDTVMSYGSFNAALGALLPLVHKVFNIKKEDYASDIDFQSEKTKIDARVVATVRIGEVLLVLICALFAFAKWYFRFKRRSKAENRANAGKNSKEKITENSSAEKGN